MPENKKQFLSGLQNNKLLASLLAVILILVIIILAILSSFFGRTGKTAMFQYGTIAGQADRDYSVTDSYVNIAPEAMEGKMATAPAPDRKIIKNASLDILVKKVEDTTKSIQLVALKYKGLVDNSNVSSQSTDTKFGNITIRVPNDNFTSVIDEIKTLAVKVNSENISSTDVSAQYVDLEARLKSKKAVEAQYVALLQRANKVEEIISISSYLNSVREEIERMQAQINYLSEQVAMSSITVSMTSEKEVQIFGLTWHPITVIKQAFRNLLADLIGTVNWLIYVIFLLPGLLIKLAILVGIIWLAIKVINWTYLKFKKGQNI